MASVPLVTAANEHYWPGVVALYNSYRKNGGDRYKFHAILQGGSELAEKAQQLGIGYTMNPPLGASKFLATKNRPQETAEVHFYRICAPDLFPDAERVLYLDSDSVVLNDIGFLADCQFDKPVAACVSNSPYDREMAGDGVPKGYGFISCLMLFDCAAWRKQNIAQKCIDTMQSPPVDFYTGDQAVLNWVLRGNWHRLPDSVVSHAGHNSLRQDTPILHFLGTNPWDALRPDLVRPYKLKAREIWREYSC